MRKSVILAGGGHAHLAVLADWAAHPRHDMLRTLVTASRYSAYSGMLPGWIAGDYQAEELLIDLAPLAAKAGAELVIAPVTGLNADRRELQLASGEVMAFDLLSLAIGGETDRASLAALGDRLLPVRPVDGFIARWTQFLETNAQAASLSVVIVGGGAAGVELALSVGAAVGRMDGSARVALVAQSDALLPGHNAAVRRRALVALAKRNITLHFAHATGTKDGLSLSNGEFLPADCVIAATGSRAPRWLAHSGLACDSAGFVAVGAELQSLSHASIFAAGDIINRADRRLERSGVHAVKAGPVLAANLRAALSGARLVQYQPRRKSLYLLATGDRRAILSWGRFATAGRLAWRLKDWIDRSFVSRYTDAGARGR